jgi:hypothetical protein
MIMASIESASHPFVVRIWLEETADEAGQASWRGHITHVPSGTRRYLQDLEDIIYFILPYLEGMGVTPDSRLRLKRWLRSMSSRSDGSHAEAREARL